MGATKVAVGLQPPAGELNRPDLADAVAAVLVAVGDQHVVVVVHRVTQQCELRFVEPRIELREQVEGVTARPAVRLGRQPTRQFGRAASNPTNASVSTVDR
jgi:hypothetical protein